MAKKQSRRRKTSNPMDRLAGEFASRMLFAPQNLFSEVYRLKTRTPADQLFTLFPALFRSPSGLDEIHGSAFPMAPQGLFDKPALYEHGAILNEVVWAIARVLSHGQKMRTFVQARSNFETALLGGNREAAKQQLAGMAHTFGYSLWLLQSQLSLTLLCDGVEEMRRLARAMMVDAGPGSITSFLLSYMALRTESAQRKEAQRAELEDDLKQLELAGDLSQYLFAKLFGDHDVSARDSGPLLLYDAQASIVDHYDSLVVTLQSAVTARGIAPQAVTILQRPLLALQAMIGDRRLNGVVRSLGYGSASPLSPQRATLIESYTCGRYTDVIEGYPSYVINNPQDLAMYVLALRANVRIGSAFPWQSEGVLQDIGKNLIDLFRATSTAYQSAFSIFTLNDRFHSISWMQYLRAVAQNELQTETTEFPNKEFRRMLILDPEATPFSAATSLVRRRDSSGIDAAMYQAYPATSQVFAAASIGEVSAESAIDQRRIRKYQAKWALNVGDNRRALSIYESLLGDARDDEQLRFRAGIALAQLKLGELSNAATTVVSAYLENGSLPSVLPIKAVADAFDDPSTWPNAISVALLFELYTSFCSTDKLAQLRFAFEKFLTDNKVLEPEQLVQFLPAAQSRAGIAFLDRVWRPNVMRQTVLYASTREIEEARIKVCKALSILDPGRSAIHLEEVKERVKQLEIAKGTTMIEQSKMRVELDAIKRELHRSLADSYARYKSSIPSGAATDELIIKVAQMISKAPGLGGDRSLPRLLSTMHILDTEPLSESDLQFMAIFGEVTKEFLFGDHGLNAYLSTCVRHGTLSNTLRKPVADEGIVTAREKGGTYVRNARWPRGATSADSEAWKSVLDSLDAFSKRFDQIVDFVRDELLQIRVSSILERSEDRPPALFVYTTSNLEQRYFQHIDREHADMEELVSACIDSLWDKTDSNLQIVQKRLDSEVRQRIVDAFDELEECVRSFDHVTGVGELINAIARARTATHYRLSTVISWFRRSEVYDRPDFAADFPAHIALNMVKNTMSEAANWSAVSITREGEEEMPGRTLDALVYVFYDLFANAIARSGLDVKDLALSAHIKFKAGHFEAVITNNVAASKDSQEARESIRALGKRIREADSGRRAQSERNSGLFKVWTALNAPVYCDPNLTPRLVNQSFVVDISFQLGGGTYEDLVH
jgi:hypothetical protein